MTHPFELNKRDPITGALVPVSATERVRALLNAPNPDELIPAIDVQSFHALVQEAGLDEAWELLALATPEQLVAFVDLDAWKEDALDSARFADWLDIVLQLPDDRFSLLWESLDPELAVLWLRTHTGILIWEDDEELIDAIDGPVATSPDGVFAIVFENEEEHGPLVRHLLERVYALGIEQGHRLLQAVRWELSAQLTEEAWVARRHRLEDLGYAPPEEAVEVYAWRDPRVWTQRVRDRAGQATGPDVALVTGLLPPLESVLQRLEASRSSSHPSALSRAISALSLRWRGADLEALVDSIVSQLRAIINRVHVADGGEPGDRQRARQSAERAEGYLNIGLALTARDQDALAASILGTTPLKLLHQIGYSATAQLGREANRWTQAGRLGILENDPLSLLQPAERDVMEGLLRMRPALDAEGNRTFQDIADVEFAARLLRDVAAQAVLFQEQLGWSMEAIASWATDARSTGVDQVRFRTLLNTCFLHGVGSNDPTPPVPAPVQLDQARQTLAALGGRSEVESAWEALGDQLLDHACSTLPGARPALQGFVQATRIEFVEGLSEDPASTPDASLITMLLIR